MKFVVFLILLPSLALAQFQQPPAYLPMPVQGMSPPAYLPPYPPALGNSMGYGNGYGNLYGNAYGNQYGNPMQIPGGYPYYGSPYGMNGMNNMYGYSPYGGYNPGMVNGMNNYGYPYGGYNQYGGGNQNNYGLGGLAGIFAQLTLGGLTLGFGTGGGQQPCYACMNGGSMANPMMGPMNFGGPSMFGNNNMGTEAGFLGPSVFVPGGDRIAGVDAPPVIDRGSHDRPGVGPRTPAVLPMPSGGSHTENQRKIFREFTAAFNQCAPGCTPVGYGIEGGRYNYHEDGTKTPKPSCHWEGLAVDLPAMKCGGRTIWAIEGGNTDFAKMVQCMRGKMGTVLYRLGKYADKTTDHRDHAHFSNGCTSMGRRMG